MDGYQHGGYRAEEDSRRILDFSASVSPLGVPARVRRAIRRAAAQADAYPDPQCRRLREALAEAETRTLAAVMDAEAVQTAGTGKAVGTGQATGTGRTMGTGQAAGTGKTAEAGDAMEAVSSVNSAAASDADHRAGTQALPPDRILCGNGAADLIYRAVQAVCPVRAVLPAPTFSEYETALRTFGCTDIVRVPLSAENGFQPEFAFFRRFMQALSETAEGPGMAFLCQPNNPTGISIPRPVLLQILEHCREKGYTLVLDECFLPFLDRPEDFTLAAALASYENLLILRAFTKLYGMAGVRLGYALSSSGTLLDRMERYAPPWNVSALAQAAGLAALDSGDYLRRVRRLVARERSRLLAGLDALRLRTIPGEANFLLFRSPIPLDEALWKQGIVLRNCASFHGLDESWYRTAVRTGPENRRLLAALEKALRRTR